MSGTFYNVTIKVTFCKTSISMGANIICGIKFTFNLIKSQTVVFLGDEYYLVLFNIRNICYFYPFIGHIYHLLFSSHSTLSYILFPGIALIISKWAPIKPLAVPSSLSFTCSCNSGKAWNGIDGAMWCSA